MSSSKLEPVYSHVNIEDKIYEFWLKGDYFRAGKRPGSEPFTIVIPPPNVTGSLHMGHALDNTIQDVIIRWKRMQGFDTLWLPGTDHAGIATQIRVEEDLKRDGISRHDLGREAFLKKVWEWKDSYHEHITSQLQKLGVSCDWSRERFTLDEGCSQAVTEVFVSLYRNGLIYRGDYMINWCPRCQTALSDVEVEHEEEDATLTYIKYPVMESDSEVVVATTRPETMLGDTAVAVHPEDERYVNIIGKKVFLPLMEREIPVIADSYVDPSFGSGVVKITPAHDPNDWEIGQRHKLENIKVIGDDAIMTEEAGVYSGMDRQECRKKVVADLQKGGYIEKIEDYRHAPGRCQRCTTVVEPLVSRQWFVSMKPLAKEAAEVVRNNKVCFVPERFANIYLNWIDNIRDWCISRQIWWGHRIPAWYCSCGETIVDYEKPSRCPVCGGDSLTRDPDVLDTWFSSGLWPFSTMGWPEETEDLKRFFPTDVLVTGYDIIYFWVARMIIMSLAFMKEVPFHTVSIHGLVRDAAGKKMSKSLGNGIDPIEIINELGADTLRFTLITGQAPGNDQRFRQESVEASRNFANKIWNASRFILMNLDDEGEDCPESNGVVYNLNPEDLSPELKRAHRWILHRYNDTVSHVTALLDKHELGEAARRIYDFLWSDFCDWFLELSKQYIYPGEKKVFNAEEKKLQKITGEILLYVLKGTLSLLHPIMPFITEEIYQNLPGCEKSAIIEENWPLTYESFKAPAAAKEMELVQETIRGIRKLRSEVELPPSRKAPVVIRASAGASDLLKEEERQIKTLAFVSDLSVEVDAEKPDQALTAIISNDVEVFLPLKDAINLDEEIQRLTKELENAGKEVDKTAKKINNPEFLKKAPEPVIEKVKLQHGDAFSRYKKIEERLNELIAMKD